MKDYEECSDCIWKSGGHNKIFDNCMGCDGSNHHMTKEEENKIIERFNEIPLS